VVALFPEILSRLEFTGFANPRELVDHG
jgi:hypothetical protein